MKGIILAGGTGTRLYPLTIVDSKQLLPVYDKPMVYYPMSTLMLAGIREILVITTPYDANRYKKLFGDGSQWGISITYAQQPTPDGLAQAFIIGEEFIGNDSCVMILGDNIFYGERFKNYLTSAIDNLKCGISSIFGYSVSDPERFGVIDFDNFGNVISIEEKPKNPKSNYAVTGIYFYTPDVCAKAKEIEPSKRGELEITDLNNKYLEERKLKAVLLGNEIKWWDAGTFDSLMDVSEYVRHNSGGYCCYPEVVAYLNNWISKEQLVECANKYKSPYGPTIKNILNAR